MDTLRNLLLDAQRALDSCNTDPALLERLKTAAAHPSATVMPEWWPQAVEFARETLKGYPQRGEALDQVRDWLARRAEDHARAVLTADQMLSGAVIETAQGEPAIPVSRLAELSGLLVEIDALSQSLATYAEPANHPEHVWRQADEIQMRAATAIDRLRPLISIQQDSSTK